jgi:hypothetical protein
LGAAADYSAILGGYNNEIQSTATYSAIIGGRAQITGGTGSVALGLNNRTGLNQAYTSYIETLKYYGGFQRNVKTTIIDSNYNALYSDEIIPVDSSGGTFTITLPASPVNGQYFVVIQETGGNNVTIDGNGKNINGSGTYSLSDVTYAKMGFVFSSIADKWFLA